MSVGFKREVNALNFTVVLEGNLGSGYVIMASVSSGLRIEQK
jgi:hypothetical protein